MNRSYIGVVTTTGLEAIYSETDDVRRFLSRRLYRRRPNEAFCCWAVMTAEEAEYIDHQTKAGEHQLALRALQEYSVHFGSILPTMDDPDL